VRTRWYREQRGESSAQPAVVGDVAYVGTGDGHVIARDRRTGAERWRGQIAVNGSVGGGSGVTLVARAGVVVAPSVGHVMALEAATGREVWRYSPPPDVPYGGPNALPGQVSRTRADADAEAVYLPAWGASVSALDLRTGTVRWVWQPGRSAGDTAADGRFRSGAEGVRVSGDTVFVAAWHFLDRLGLRSEPWLVALDRATGRELWHVVLPSYTGGVVASGAPALYRNLVILGTRGGHAWAIDRSTQALAWHYVPRTRYATFAQPEVYGDALYIDGGDERLYALRAGDGTVLWAADVSGATKDLLATDRRVYYPSAGRLHVVDRASGRVITTVRAPGAEGDIFESPVTVADRRVFVNVTQGVWSFDEP